ncbi:MAG: hypothetical protein M0Z87_04650 [Actinomycetota bacterium]|nr:hypothetical protein [Actinomycetota bacterium]
MTRVSRQDIETKLRQIQGSLAGEVEEAEPTMIKVAIAAAAAVIVLTYIVGRRRGRIRSTVVEVRRV